VARGSAARKTGAAAYVSATCTASSIA
jgi:hypothetical protein